MLGLPAELRNHIYNFALTQAHEIKVCENRHNTEPGLLRTCRQIRKESSSIFRKDNEFNLAIFDFKLAPQPNHWIWSTTLDEFSFYGADSWENAKAWLKAYHAGEGPNMAREVSDSSDDSVKVLIEAFNLVEALDGVSWDVVEPALEAFKKAVDAKKGSWNFT